MNSTESLAGMLSALQAARFTSAAATTIYLYDILLTLDLEVDHIWSRFAFNLPTVLYIINRYVCLGFFLFGTYKAAEFHGVLSDAFCKMPIDFVGHMLANLAWTGTLTLRVRALWLQNRYLVWGIYVTYILIMGNFIVTASLAHSEMLETMRYILEARSCIPMGVPQSMKAIPIAPATYELFLTVLTLIKAPKFAGNPVRGDFPLLYRVLMLDGVAYFVVSATLSIANVIYWYSVPDSQITLILTLYWAIISILISRLVLNLKDVRHGNAQEATASNDAGPKLTKAFRPTQSRSQIYELGSFREQPSLQGRDIDSHILAMRANAEDKSKPWDG